MNMKLVKYMLIAILVLGTGEVAAQVQVVSGKVTEILGNQVEPIVGANVNIVNAQNRSVGGAVTNLDGDYRLQIPAQENNLTLVYSYIGMKTKRIKYTGQKVLNVKLESNVETLDEVAITAKRIERNNMGIGHKENVSATQKVMMEDLIAAAPIATVEEALQGQLSGVDIALSADPGARSSIRIRGTSTLNGSVEPLIVIDGVPYTQELDDDFDFSTANEEDLGALLNIAPTDIESEEVLKDAAATAIWGTKGANGVLSITTKKGKTGKTTFNFSSKFTAKFEPNSIPMLNGSEYIAMVQEALWNSANYTGLNADTYLKYLYDTPEINYSPNWNYFNEYNVDTNWLDEVRQNAFTTDNTFSMSGGGEKATYRLSLGYLSEGGTTIGTGLKRFNSSLRVDYNFSDKLRFGADFYFTQSDKDDNWAPKDSNVRSEAFKKMPNKSPYYMDEDGNRSSQYFSYQTKDWEGEFKASNNSASHFNPVAMANESYKNTMSRDSRANFRIDYKILPYLTYSAYASLKMSTTTTDKFLPQVATGVAWTSEYANQSTAASSESLTLQTENKLIFNKNWKDKHNLIATAVFRTTQATSSSATSTSYGNASSGLADPITGSSVYSLGSGESEARSISGTGLINYTLLDRYVFHTSATMDANSAMGKSERLGIFPTVGISWNMQNEPFMKNTEDWMDEIKLRFSIGQSGNAPKGTAAYYGAYSSRGEYMDMSAIYPSRMQLNNLKWETSTEYNLGGDFSFFHGKLRLTFEWYNKYIKDLLQKEPKMPTTTGFSKNKWYNSGRMENKGWEARIDGVLYEKKDWRVSAYVNLSRNTNEITELPETMNPEPYTFKNGEYAIRIEEGRPFGSFYGYRYKGVYQNQETTYARDKEGNVMNDVNGKPIVMKNGAKQVCPGDAIYEDINHDGVINEYDIVYLGNCNPILTGGFGFTVKYKRLSLNALFYGRFGQKIINATRMDNESMYNANNQSKAVLRRWRNEGDNTDIPRALYNEGYNYLGSDRFVEDASYVRLKTLSLSYSLPKKVCNYLGINTLNFFVTGYDLLTWTGYTGQDPEASLPTSASKLSKDSANTPCSRRFSCGLNLNF